MPGFVFVGLAFQCASAVLGTVLPNRKECAAMDRRLKELASLVGKLLAERWYRLQQEKESARRKAEDQSEGGNARQPPVVESD